MSATTQSTNQVTGLRRMSLNMLTLIDQADQFTGLPRGSAKPMRFLTAFQEAEPYLGLPAHAFKLVSWLVKFTQPQDWEEGSRPIAFPAARRQQEFLGLSAARVKALNRALFEAGIFVMRDNEQGKRYGRRDPATGRLIEAFGFDLTPLAQRYDEFIRLAAAAKVERERMKDGRRRVTFARRTIRQIGEQLAAMDALPDGWSKLEADTAALVRAAKQAERSEDITLIAGSLERRRSEAEQWLKDAVARVSEPVETSPVGLENEPHIITTNLTFNLKDTVVACEGSSQVEPIVPPSPLPSLPPRRPVTMEREFKVGPEQLLDLAPRLAAYVQTASPNWDDIANAAQQWLRHDLGVSLPLWGEACRLMGRDQAALALAIVSTKPEQHFTRGAGGYFAGMVRKFASGDLHLERTVWMLKDKKWGSAKRGQDSWKSTGNVGSFRGRH
jgi:replication initiation protein RepC